MFSKFKFNEFLAFILLLSPSLAFSDQSDHEAECLRIENDALALNKECLYIDSSWMELHVHMAAQCWSFYSISYNDDESTTFNPNNDFSNSDDIQRMVCDGIREALMQQSINHDNNRDKMREMHGRYEKICSKGNTTINGVSVYDPCTISSEPLTPMPVMELPQPVEPPPAPPSPVMELSQPVEAPPAPPSVMVLPAPQDPVLYSAPISYSNTMMTPVPYVSPSPESYPSYMMTPAPSASPIPGSYFSSMIPPSTLTESDSYYSSIFF